MLAVNQVSLSFGGVHALTDVSFTMQAHMIHGLIGPNGAGKTSLFNVISGIYAPTAGDIRFDGSPISHLQLHQINRLGVARTFQNIMLFPELSVVENVMIGRQDRTQSGILASILRTTKERAERKASHDRAMELLTYVGLAHKAKEKAASLPYGEQRQLDIARALATDPKILLLDEPAAGLNLQERIALRELILKLHAMDYTVVLIEHDIKLVMGLCEHIVVLEYGHKIADGSPQEIQGNERVIQAYLGAGVDHVEH